MFKHVLLGIRIDKRKCRPTSRIKLYNLSEVYGS